MDETKEKLGKKGEEKAVAMLKEFGFILSRPDYSGYQHRRRMFYGDIIEADEEVEFEIKTKSTPFGPKPFWGHGTDRHQIEKRMRRYRKYRIRQFFLVIEEGGKIYGNWLHRLVEGRIHITPTGIMIFPLDSFYVIENIFG